MAAPQSDSAKRLQTIRQVANQTKFARKVFTQGVTGLTGAQVLGEFKAILEIAGIKPTKELTITLDVVQVILAGGAFVPGLGNSVSIFSSANPGTAAIGAVTQLLVDLDIVPSEVSDYVMLGVNVALVISSGGTNILAHIGLIISVINVSQHIEGDIFGSEDAAKTLALKAIRDWEMNQYGAQYKKASAALREYSQGKMTYFDLIGTIALDSPVRFKDFFPELAIYFPSWLSTEYVAWGEHCGVGVGAAVGIALAPAAGIAAAAFGWGKSCKHVEERKKFIELLTTKQEVKKVLVDKFIVAPMTGFIAERWGTKHISLKAMSVLSMLASIGTEGAQGAVGFDFDVIGFCRVLGLTPAKLGDHWLFEGGFGQTQLMAFDPERSLPYPPMTLPPGGFLGGGVVINGKATLTEAEKAQNAYTESLIGLQQLMWVLDQRGDIESLLKIPEARAQLEAWSKWMVYPSWDLDQNWTDFSKFTTQEERMKFEPVNLILKTGRAPITSQPFFKPFATPLEIDNSPMREYLRQNYLIDLSDYWKGLSVIDQMERSKLFADPLDQKFLGLFDDMREIEAQFQEAYGFSVCKTMNLQARQNIQGYLGGGEVVSRVTDAAGGEPQIVFKSI